MTLYDLLPTKKVTAFVLSSAITVAAFWVLIEMGILEDWPEAWVMAAFAIIIGFIVAWIVPGSAWKKIDIHLTGRGTSASGVDTDISGDVSLTPTGEGTAEIEGEVSVEEDNQQDR